MKELNLTEEIIEKAKEAKTVEELLLLAKENGLDLNDERAVIYFEKNNPKFGQLEDEELDNVSGGGCEVEEEDKECNICHNTEKFETVTHGQSYSYECSICGSSDFTIIKKNHADN